MSKLKRRNLMIQRSNQAKKMELYHELIKDEKMMGIETYRTRRAAEEAEKLKMEEEEKKTELESTKKVVKAE